MQLVPILTKVVSSNPAHGDVYSIQHYVIEFVSDLRQVGGFLRFPLPKRNRYNITEIWLKVALNTINPRPILILIYMNNTRYIRYIK